MDAIWIRFIAPGISLYLILWYGLLQFSWHRLEISQEVMMADTLGSA